MPGRLEFDVELGPTRKPERTARRNGEPLRILVMGDFSGRGGRERGDLEHRSIHGLDIDTFERVLHRLAPAINCAGHDGSQSSSLEIQELDDFHPDRLYQNLDVFAALRDLRIRIDDPSTFEAAAAELMRFGLPSPLTQEETPPQDSTEAGSVETGEAVLERLLGAGPTAARTQARRSSGSPAGIDDLIRKIVTPHVVPGASASSAPYLSAIDSAVAERMRALMHDTNFQSIEAGWRGLRWLVDNLELDDAIRLSVLDVSKDELLADARTAGEAPGDSPLYRLLTGCTGLPGEDHSWSLIVGNYSFNPDSDDLLALRLMGTIGAQTGACFIASASARLTDSRDLTESPGPRNWTAMDSTVNQQWADLRASAVAAHIGLVMPRILLRLPYGDDTDPIEAFDFEELNPGRPHESFLWCNPAFGCALLLGQSFMESRWDMAAGEHLEIADLPAFSFEQDGEKQLQACGEVYLSQRAGESILEEGIMPFLSYANRNAVRLMRFQSIAEPAQGLAGPWR